MTVSRSLLRMLRWAMVVALLVAAFSRSAASCRAFWRRPARHIRAGDLVAAASIVTLLAYAVLIECWRRVLSDLGGHLPFSDAALIWLGSNLARYIPGVGWQIGVMGAMAQQRRVPLSTSTAASLLTTVAST